MFLSYFFILEIYSDFFNIRVQAYQGCMFLKGVKLLIPFAFRVKNDVFGALGSMSNRSSVQFITWNKVFKRFFAIVLVLATASALCSVHRIKGDHTGLLGSLDYSSSKDPVP